MRFPFLWLAVSFQVRLDFLMIAKLRMSPMLGEEFLARHPTNTTRVNWNKFSMIFKHVAGLKKRICHPE